MCLPSVTWSSVALATPNASSKKVQAAVVIISRRFQFSADTVDIFSKVETRFNQRDLPEYDKLTHLFVGFLSHLINSL